MLRLLFRFLNIYSSLRLQLSRLSPGVPHKSAVCWLAWLCVFGRLRLLHHDPARSTIEEDENDEHFLTTTWTSLFDRMIPSSVQWIILISEIFLPYLHLLTIAAFLVLTGISISTSFITIPLLFQNDTRNNNGLEPTNLANLRTLVTRTSDITGSIEQALLVSLIFLSFFSLRYSDAEVHWRLPYHLASLAVFVSMLVFDAKALFGVEERISLMDPDTVENERLGKSLEAASLMREWRSLRRRRIAFPFLAGFISLWSFAQK